MVKKAFEWVLNHALDLCVIAAVTTIVVVSVDGYFAMIEATRGVPDLVIRCESRILARAAHRFDRPKVNAKYVISDGAGRKWTTIGELEMGADSKINMDLYEKCFVESAP